MGAPKRILIVDGDPHFHQTLRDALAASDREFKSAFDETEGLRDLQNSAPHLILTSNEGTLATVPPQIPVIVIVIAHASGPEKVLRALCDGAFAYFSRPFIGSALAAMVEQALARGRSEDEIEILSALPHWLALRLRCTRDAADRVLQFMRELAAELHASERENFATALREILSNAIEHGGHLDPGKKVFLTYIRTARALMCHIHDPGEGFSFQRLAHAAVSNPAEFPFAHAEIRQQMGMRPGGFGILMARQFVDELIYNEKGNEILLIKYLPQQ